MLDLERIEASKIEVVSLKDLERIDQKAKNFQINLILIGGYAVRAYTYPRSWRFTKDVDFITTRRELTALRGVFELLEYSFEKTDFGVKGSKKINLEPIELHISVDKVIDWSTNLEYILPEDIFTKANKINIKASFEENKDLKVGATVAPIEDILIMKLMTERTRDHFDAIAMILDSFKRLNIKRLGKLQAIKSKSTYKEKVEFFFGRNKKGFSKETLERIHWKRVHKRARSYPKGKDKQVA